LPKALDNLKRRGFWIVANVCFKMYGWFPLLGTLRAALGVIYADGKFLIIHRNDGRGYCLPGGLCNWRETEEATLGREVREETGMTVGGKELILRFYNATDFPCNVSIYRVRASGEVRDSWEGSPRWMKIGEFERDLVESQRPVLEVLRAIERDEKMEREPDLRIEDK
jgi:ADP-ribose pyrophosphatase YjhB (NUDIX family)